MPLPPRPTARRARPSRWRRPHRLAGLKPRIIDPPFGHQHALDLAQRQVRVARQLQRMRQHHQVEAVVRERARRRSRNAAPRRLEGQAAVLAVIGRRHRQRLRCVHRVAGHPAVRHAVGAQALAVRAGRAAARGSRRHRPPPGRECLFPVQQALARRGSQPVAQLYNRCFANHDVDSPARLRHFAPMPHATAVIGRAACDPAVMRGAVMPTVPTSTRAASACGAAGRF